MPRGKEIEISGVKRVPHEDLSKKTVVFQYKGRVREINDFVKLAREAGFSTEMPEEQSIEGILQLKMAFPRGQFDKFREVLHKWKTDGQK